MKPWILLFLFTRIIYKYKNIFIEENISVMIIIVFCKFKIKCIWFYFYNLLIGNVILCFGCVFMIILQLYLK